VLDDEDRRRRAVSRALVSRLLEDPNAGVRAALDALVLGGLRALAVRLDMVTVVRGPIRTFHLGDRGGREDARPRRRAPSWRPRPPSIDAGLAAGPPLCRSSTPIPRSAGGVPTGKSLADYAALFGQARRPWSARVEMSRGAFAIRWRATRRR
jgi:hypothetical protein